MGLYNKYVIELEGSRWPNGTGSPVSATFWLAGIEDGVTLEGEEKEYGGGGVNDGGLMRRTAKLNFIPFGYAAGSIEGHDNAKYEKLLVILSKRYKRIKSITGVNMIGADGTTQFYTGLLSSPFEFAIASLDVAHPYDGTKRVTVDIKRRSVGL